MKEKTKKVIAGVSAGAILATMAGCENAKQKNKEEVSDLENSTKLEDSTIGSTTEEELSSFLNDYDIAFPEEETTKRYNPDNEVTTRKDNSGNENTTTTKSGGRIDEETTKIDPPETTKIDPPSTTEYDDEEDIDQRNLRIEQFVNTNELSEEFIRKYREDFDKLLSMDNLDNVLIVRSITGIKDTYGSVFVVEAANHLYYLQYNNEEEKNYALGKFEELKEKGKIFEVSSNAPVSLSRN